MLKADDEDEDSVWEDDLAGDADDDVKLELVDAEIEEVLRDEENDEELWVEDSDLTVTIESLVVPMLFTTIDEEFDGGADGI